MLLSAKHKHQTLSDYTSIAHAVLRQKLIRLHPAASQGNGVISWLDNRAHFVFKIIITFYISVAVECAQTVHDVVDDVSLVIIFPWRLQSTQADYLEINSVHSVRRHVCDDQLMPIMFMTQWQRCNVTTQRSCSQSHYNIFYQFSLSWNTDTYAHKITCLFLIKIGYCVPHKLLKHVCSCHEANNRLKQAAAGECWYGWGLTLRLGWKLLWWSTTTQATTPGALMPFKPCFNPPKKAKRLP